MQKAFEGIVERLEERLLSQYSMISVLTAIEIVNQVAEKYKQEVCEWKPNFERKTFTGHYYCDCDDEMLFTKVEVESFNVCPYCGKKIKVIQ